MTSVSGMRSRIAQSAHINHNNNTIFTSHLHDGLSLTHINHDHLIHDDRPSPLPPTSSPRHPYRKDLQLHVPPHASLPYPRTHRRLPLLPPHLPLHLALSLHPPLPAHIPTITMEDEAQLGRPRRVFCAISAHQRTRAVDDIPR